MIGIGSIPDPYQAQPGTHRPRLSSPRHALRQLIPVATDDDGARLRMIWRSLPYEPDHRDHQKRTATISAQSRT